ncbi:MAG TPA: DUF4097 family beta strand repeat-containing protein [Ktedonobacterales bacterium]|nr:DUF4097 family beta strand repeat-containing protein [Ktedonobacterales bacterium]
MERKTPVPDYREVPAEAFERRGRSSAPTVVAPAQPPAKSMRARRRSPRWFVWMIGCALAVILLALLACALVGGLIMGIAIKLASEVTASVTYSQSFAISGVPSLDIHNASGHLSVRQGAPGTVSVAITKTARDSSSDAAQHDLGKIQVAMTQSGDTISVTSNFQDTGFLATSSAVNMQITVPATTNISADIKAGDVQIDSVGGLMALSTSAGNVTMWNTTLADGSHMHVSTGSVTVQGSVPDNASVDISVSTGDVALTLPAETSTRLDARTNIGEIHVTGWPVQPKRANNVGEMTDDTLGGQPTGAIRIRVDAGDITISKL